MDNSSDNNTLQVLDSEIKKLRTDTSKVMLEYSSVKNSAQEIINDLECKNQTLLKDLPIETDELNKDITILEKELSELQIECSKEAALLSSQQKIAEDEAREMKMMADFKTQYSLRLAKASAKPSKGDIELLEKCRKKLEAYVKLTGVVWDFESCDKNTLSGYIRNATDTKMKVFNINIAGKSREEISDEMWKVIKKYSSA